MLTSTLWARRSLHAAEAHTGSRSIAVVGEGNTTLFDLQFCPGGMYFLIGVSWYVWVWVCLHVVWICMGHAFLPLFHFYHETCFLKAKQFASLIRGLNSALYCCWDTLLSLSVENPNQPLLRKLQALLIADAGELAGDVSLAGLLSIFCWARIWVLLPFRKVLVLESRGLAVRTRRDFISREYVLILHDFFGSDFWGPLWSGGSSLR